MATFQPYVTSPTLRYLNVLNSWLGSHTRWIRPTYAKIWDGFFKGNFISNGKQVYQDHHDSIRRIVDKEKLLIYDVRDGWEPLCGFLGQNVPQAPFPSGNNVECFQKRMEALVIYIILESGATMGRVLVYGGAAFYIYYLAYRGS